LVCKEQLETSPPDWHSIEEFIFSTRKENPITYRLNASASTQDQDLILPIMPIMVPKVLHE
jgi:hypothetical protein